MILIMSSQTLSFHNIHGENSTAQSGNESEVQLYSAVDTIVQNLNWTVQNTPFGIPGLMMISPKESPSDMFRENIVIQVWPLWYFGLSKNMTKQEIDRSVVENQTKMFKLNFLGEKDTVLGSLPAHEMDFTTKNDLLGGEVYTRLIWAVKNNHLIFTTITSKPEKYPDFESKFQSILNAFPFPEFGK